MRVKYGQSKESQDQELLVSAQNLINEIKNNWLPNIAERRSNETLRKGDLFRCQLAKMMIPFALEVTDNEELRKTLNETQEAVDQYEAALKATNVASA